MTSRVVVLVLLAVLACGAIAGALVGRKALHWRKSLRQLNARLADVQGMSPYAAENDRLASEGRTPDVVFLGASHTIDWGDLGRRLPGLTVMNRGLGGMLVPQYLLRFRQDVLTLSPKVVVFEGCAINAGFKVPVRTLVDTYASLAELSRLHGIEPVITTHMPVGPQYENLAPGTNKAVAELNEALRALAQKNGYALADYSRIATKPDGFLDDPGSKDGLHASAALYDRMFTVLKPALDDALSRSRAASVAR